MGLDISHFIPVKESEPYDGFEFIEEAELDSNNLLSARFKDFLSVQIDGGYYLYFRELGTQRKGMSKAFYDNFESGFYFEIKKVKEALQYIQGDHIAAFETHRNNFKTTFIENFIEGKSVFYVSY